MVVDPHGAGAAGVWWPDGRRAKHRARSVHLHIVLKGQASPLPTQIRRPQNVCGRAGFVLLVCAALVPTMARGATYYVRTSGSDQADGTSPSTAFRSIGKAAASLTNPGVEVVVGPGAYVEGDISPARNGI